MTQHQAILHHLKSGKTLTSRSAVELGIYRLSARMHELIQKGHPIVSERKQVPTRHGDKVSVSVWSYAQQ